MELRDVMKQRRETLSLTQQDLAEMSQVGHSFLSDKLKCSYVRIVNERISRFNRVSDI